MVIEAIVALIIGAAVLVLVLEPLTRIEHQPIAPIDPEEAEESARGRAVAALREIEFDQATGKLSDADYAALKSRYTGVALEALRAEARGADSLGEVTGDLEAQVAARVVALRAASASGAAVCPACGPRPESDALFCSHCGRSLKAADHCRRCRAGIPVGSRFCESCGEQVAA